MIAAIDCSFIGKSGKPWGVDNFYNGSGKSQKRNFLSGGRVCPSRLLFPPAVNRSHQHNQQLVSQKVEVKVGTSNSERVKGYLEQLKTARAHLPTAVKYLAADSFYSKKYVVDGVVALDLHLVSKLRIDADLRYCYTGEQKSRMMARWSDLSRLELSGGLADGTKMYSQVVWHVSLKRKIRIVDHRNPDKQRVALLFSTDTTLDPLRRTTNPGSFDAKQFTGLCDCQSAPTTIPGFSFQCVFGCSQYCQTQTATNSVGYW